LITRDELVGLIGNFYRYGGNGGDRAFYLEAWNGGAYSVDRVKNNNIPTQVAFTSLAILGNIQPDKLNQIITQEDDGLASRFLYAYPQQPPFSELKQHSDLNIEQIQKAFEKLHSLKMDCD